MMEKWDGFIRDGDSIVFDGKEFLSMKKPEGGYGPYHVWVGGKFVAIITKTQHEYLNDLAFWQRRYDEQMEYFQQLNDRKFECDDRMHELFISACEVFDLIEKQIIKIGWLQFELRRL